MASCRITVRIPKSLVAVVRDRSVAQGQTPSDLVRIALESISAGEDSPHSACELAQEAGLIGCVRQAPKDLSTTRRHFPAVEKNK
jgi:hypothetical protein